MSAPDEIVIPLLPKEHLDLPKPQEALPVDLPKEIPSHTTSSRDYFEEEDTQVKTLLSWHAAGRPFRRREKEYYINIAVITLALLVILFLFSQYLLMLLALAVVFLNYALTTVAPHDFRYRITNQGITIENHFYYWDELYDFYFKNEDGEQMLHVATRYYFPGELILTLGTIHREQIQSVLIKYISYREVVRPSYMERAGEWLSRTFPLEKRPS